MKKRLVVAALLAACASPAAAVTVLDFTSSAINTNASGDPVIGSGYTISGSAALTNATHKNNVGCTGSAGGNFACSQTSPTSGVYDVGFGVKGLNNNEVDGVRANEYVQVAFGGLVKVLGFAGMLTYDDSQTTYQSACAMRTTNGCYPTRGTETVILQYSTDGLTWGSLTANALNDDNDNATNTGTGNNKFDTVGLAFWQGPAVSARYVRFTAGGVYPYDDYNTNITAAGLTIAAVPVPAALPLLVAGLGALGMVGARRKRAKAA